MTEDPSHLGRYRILSRLGSGAMGDVFLAEDPQIDRKLAIKTVKLHGSDEEVETRKQRMLVEARAAGRIVHPHAVTLFDAGEDAGTVFLAFEYVEGQDLGVRLKQGERVTLREALELIQQTSQALHSAHKLGIVHRDIKPSNIMLTADGSAKIGDFGIAKLHNQQTELTTTGMLIGTPHYMSPEQVKGETLDGRSDVFSLGSVLFELLHRRRPFPSDTLTTLVYQILHEDPTEGLRANLPHGLSELVCAMLAKDLQERPDAGEVAKRVTALLDQLTPDELEHDASTVEGIAVSGSVVQAAPSSSTGPPPPPAPPAAGLGVDEQQPTALLPSTASEPRPAPASTPAPGAATTGSSAAASSGGRRWLPWALGLGCVGVGGLGAIVAVLVVLSGIEQGLQSTEEQRQAQDLGEADSLPVEEPATPADSVDDVFEANESPSDETDGDAPDSEAGLGVEPGRTPPSERASTAAEPPPPRSSTPARQTRPTTTVERSPSTARAAPRRDPPVAAVATPSDPEPETATDPPARPVEDLASVPVDEERSVSTQVGFRIEPDDAFVLFRAPGDARFTNIGRSRDYDMKRKRRAAFQLPGPGTYLVVVRREGYDDYTLRLQASEGGSPSLIEVALSP